MLAGITHISFRFLKKSNNYRPHSICDTFSYCRIRSVCQAYSYSSASNFSSQKQTTLNRSSAFLVEKPNLRTLRIPVANKFSIMAPVLQPSQLVKKLIDSHRVMIFSKSTCPYCCSAKQYFVHAGIPYEVLELDHVENGDKIQRALQELSGQRTVPNIYINGVHVGGADALFAMDRAGKINELLNKKSRNIDDNSTVKNQNTGPQSSSGSQNPDPAYDYDLVVVGGGSGGLATSKEAAKYGKKVAVFDYIVPTPIGTTWGLGGTCVNVGCIPKKLMHQAALLNEFASDSVSYGWQYPQPKADSITTNSTESDPKTTIPLQFDNPARVHSWNKLVTTIQDYLHSLNFKYRTQLREKSVKYYNAYARFIDPHTIEGKEKNGKTVRVTSKYFLIATGLRPHYLDIPGAKEYCITSDDIFSLDYPPGKTLCVGASYISLETAGFLQGLGFPTSVMVRSILLRGFDAQMAEMVGKYMEKHGVTFIRPAIPTKIEKIEDGKPGRYMVHYQMEDGSTHSEEFNTILLAIGRVAKTEHLGIKELGVKLNPKNNKLITHNEQSSISHIYGVGDNIDGKPELTPVAIEAGTLLARRLFAQSNNVQCDYDSVPTTVFTPLEYGACGLSEEEARTRYGDQDIEVYHTGFKPLEWTIPGREDNACYGKLVVVKSQNEKVVGIHYLGPNAGEVIQGYAVAIKVGVTKADFDRTIGIHPTQSEIFTTLTVTKSSGKAVEQAGC